MKFRTYGNELLQYSVGGGNGNGNGTRSGRNKSQFQIEQKVTYGASIGTSTSAFADLFQSGSHVYANKIENLRNITIKNTGQTAIELKFDIDAWTASGDGTPDDNSATERFLMTLLATGEHIYLPSLRLLDYDTAVLSSGSEKLIDNLAPARVNSGALYADSSWTLGAHLDEPDTSITVNTSNHNFYVGDLIQVGTDTTTVTRIEIMQITKVDDETIYVNRGLYGTSKADKDSQTDATEGAVSGAKIFLPFFNMESNSNQYSGYSTAQTSEQGIFHIKNFFGYGRYLGEIANGVTMGSLSGKFYSSGYQSLGLAGITSSTNYGLTASTNYAFDIQVDGATNFDNLTFTTDSSNVTFGNVIQKINSALSTQYYTSGNLFEKKVSVGIVDGDLRFTSGSRLTTSAIALTAEDGADASFFGTGRIPAVGSIRNAVPAFLPVDSSRDRASGVEHHNTSELFWDDGHGNIQGSARGTINYATGELRLTGAPASANFVFSVNYGAASSGGVKVSSVNSANGIMEISARSLNHKVDGTVSITADEI